MFEKAARIRNAIKAVEELTGAGSSVVDFDPEGRDYIAWASEGVLTTFTVFSMRGGTMTGRDLYRTRSAASKTESLESFITSYYAPDRPPPAKIFAADTAFPSPSLAGWFRAAFGSEPEFLQPLEKHHAAIYAMARQNAVEDLRKRLKERGAGPALDELAVVLNLKTRPERIEGFDIAQLDGKHPVASLVSFKNGIPDKKNYRYYKLRTVIGVVDDFAAMREAVRRRYSRLIREGAELPDLVLIDGGIGQVNAAEGVMRELGMDSDVAGIAKRNEELWLPGVHEPVVLSRQSEVLKVLQFVSDETHRFATDLNQRLRSGDLFFSVLESVEGIGPKRAAAIMKAFETIDAIAAADPQDIAGRCRISETSAKAVRAAARLALEDREAGKSRLNAGGMYRAPGPGAASLAAEATDDTYGEE
jgi:excinuclease ABC subunit C